MTKAPGALNAYPLCRRGFDSLDGINDLNKGN